MNKSPHKHHNVLVLMGKLTSFGVAMGAQTQGLKQLVTETNIPLLDLAVQGDKGHNGIFQRGKLWRQNHRLGHDPKGLRWQFPRVTSGRHIAMMGLQMPRECAQQRGFAAGRRPLNHRSASTLQRECDIIQSPTGLPRITEKNMMRRKKSKRHASTVTGFGALGKPFFATVAPFFSFDQRADLTLIFNKQP
jgi:hypothetical protein